MTLENSRTDTKADSQVTLIDRPFDQHMGQWRVKNLQLWVTLENSRTDTRADSRVTLTLFVIVSLNRCVLRSRSLSFVKTFDFGEFWMIIDRAFLIQGSLYACKYPFR